jgi:ubiquinone/menaquinone biosynthesis C-methylase UbiE
MTRIHGLLQTISKTLQYTSLVVLNFFSKPRLKRTPEPFALTEHKQHVEDYDRAIHTIMVLPYVLVMDFVYRLTNKDDPKKALDLCCGPGHFTRMLAKHLKCHEVIGVDLSEPMLKKAQDNAQSEKLSEVLRYVKSDVASLDSIESKSMDIVSFMDGAHHMSSIQDVTKILKEADRVAKPEGIVILLDPVRPKTVSTTNLYHRIAGKPYVDLGLSYFNKDFYDSLLASWSPDELFESIPKDTSRKWVQLVPFGFPAFQIVLGLPAGQDEIFAGKGLPRTLLSCLIDPEWKADWNLLKFSFRLAKQKVRAPEKACQTLSVSKQSFTTQ